MNSTFYRKPKNKNDLYLLLLALFLTFFSSGAQSLIVGIPSADVAEKQHLEFTHETQSNFWEKPNKWNSFNFMCLGVGHNAEMTLTLNNMDNESSNNLAIGYGGKKVFNLFKNASSWENKVVLGANILYSTKRENFGIWSYALYSLRIPNTKTRLTAGLSYGTSHTYGFRTQFVNNSIVLNPNNITTVLLGFEQPLTKNLSVIGDWYSGTHALAAFIPALQYDLGHHVLIAGYKIANNKEVGSNALILEFMINIPIKKKYH